MQLELGRLEGFLQHYLTAGLPTGRWNYTDDILAVGAYGLWRATGSDAYRQGILRLTEQRLPRPAQKEEIPHNLDAISAAKTYRILAELTGQECFRRWEEFCRQRLEDHPRTASGNFWHKDIYPYQVWLDGLYMAMPIYMRREDRQEDALAQFRVVRQKLYDSRTKLYRHAWDERRQQEWADPATGQSPNVWLRAMGWYLMALTDCFPLTVSPAGRQYLAGLLREAADGLLPYRDPGSGMFLQLVDLAGEEGNYPETSGTAMAAYALMKGSRLGMLPPEYQRTGGELLACTVGRQLFVENGADSLHGICASAGLGPGPDNRPDRDGTVRYYLSERIGLNNPHGVAAVMMAAGEYILGTQRPTA